MNIRTRLERLELEEVAKYREMAEQIIAERMYGLKSISLVGDLRVRTFCDGMPSHVVVKDDIPAGFYEIMIRPPEVSSLKIDFNIPRKIRGTKQIRMYFTRNDWKKLSGI